MNKILITLVLTFGLGCYAMGQSQPVEVNEYQIFYPLLEIEDLSSLTFDNVDEKVSAIKNFHLVSRDTSSYKDEKCKKFTLDLSNENYTFMGKKLCECYFSFDSKGPWPMFSMVTIDLSASSDREAIEELVKLCNMLNSSKLIKVSPKLKLKSERFKLDVDDAYKTDKDALVETYRFAYTAGNYAARRCHLTMHRNSPKGENPDNSMFINDMKMSYTIKISFFWLFYKDGKYWRSLFNNKWGAKGKYLDAHKSVIL